MTLSLPFSERSFEQKVSLQRTLLRFSAILLFRNEARHAGQSRKNAGMRDISQNTEFPARLRDG